MDSFNGIEHGNDQLPPKVAVQVESFESIEPLADDRAGRPSPAWSADARVAQETASGLDTWRAFSMLTAFRFIQPPMP